MKTKRRGPALPGRSVQARGPDLRERHPACSVAAAVGLALLVMGCAGCGRGVPENPEEALRGTWRSGSVLSELGPMVTTYWFGEGGVFTQSVEFTAMPEIKEGMQGTYSVGPDVIAFSTHHGVREYRFTFQEGALVLDDGGPKPMHLSRHP